MTTRTYLTALALRLLVAILPALCLLSCAKKDPAPTLPPVVAPVLTGVTLAEVTPTSAKASATISAVGSGTAATATISEYGFCYGPNANPTTTDTKLPVGTTTAKSVDITGSLTGLKVGSAYFVRAYASHADGTAYGEQATFTTGAYKAPTVITGDGLEITRSELSIIGELKEVGSSEVTQYGHVLSESSQTPTLADVKTELGGATAPKGYKSTYSGLRQNTTYYLRAYATNATGGTGYGTVKTVKTLNEVAPTVETQSFSSPGITTVTAIGRTLTTGTQGIAQHGHVWSSTNQTPTTADTKTEMGPSNAPRDYTSSLTNLAPNTTYYVRAYATSPVGTGYGEVKPFKTQTGAIPTVETLLVPGRSFTTATLEGRVLVAGAPVISRYGHVWSSTNQNPTTSDSKNELTLAGGLSGFISDIRNLLLNTTYYYRAYATNEVGTGYGGVKTFLTYGQPPTYRNSAGTWYNSEAVVNFGVSINPTVERLSAYGVVETDGTDKNNLADPIVDNPDNYFYRAQRDYSTTQQNLFSANQYVELQLFIRKGGTDANPVGQDSGLTITNGKVAKAIYKKMRVYVVGQSGIVYYGPTFKNF